MKTLFGKLLISVLSIIILIIAAILASFILVYSRSYEEQIKAENAKQAQYVGTALYAFMHSAYKEVESLAFNSDVISLDTSRQTPVFVSSVDRNDYFELLYAQGMDGMQTGRSSGTLGNRRERWWFIQMEAERRPFISESYFSVGTNMPCASVFFHIMIDQEMIGIMAGDIKLSALHDLVMETVVEGSYTYILDGRGVVVAHPNRSYEEELYNFATLTRTVALRDDAGNPIQDAAGNLTEELPIIVSDAYKAAIENMMKGNSGSERFRESGNFLFLSYLPVQMDGYSEPWYVLSVMDGSEAMQVRNSLILVILGSSAVIVFIALFIVFFVARNISSPIKKVRSVLLKIKEGDLTQHIETKGKDEVSQMTVLLKETQESLKNLIVNIREESNILSQAGAELANDMTKTAATMNEINGNLQGVRGMMANQNASVTETNATMEQITVSINKLNGNVEKQTSSVAQSSSAIEQMLANIQSVTQTLVKNSENVEKLGEASELGRTGLQDVAADIQEIARESEGILEINTVMENIASQTNLLSMNAAIEAAHAGEAGKGFAVVADEIRKLAVSSSEQSKTISTVLKKIKGSIDKITLSTDNVLKRFEAIDSNIKIVAEKEENIRNAMEEQGQGSKQILDAISDLNDSTQLVKDGSQEMLEGAKEVMQEAGNLEKSTQEINNSINEMAYGVAESNSAVNHINELANKNQKTAAQLMKDVQKFKIV